jgi:hypothetical protein
MTVIANTTIISNFAAVGRLDVLRDPQLEWIFAPSFPPLHTTHAQLLHVSY